jgi:iron-sulfur cluster repair protein YtfE (RIC family)
MDDFLHNLRSGKLKQTDRGRRDYSDYKGPQRRVNSDRRKTDYYAKVTNENFALIKETLDALSVSQKRIADAVAERGKTEARIADALENIAKMMEGRHLETEEAISQPDETSNMESEAPPHPSEMATESSAIDVDDEGSGAESQPDLISIISTMRDQGTSWEKIARYVDEQNIPTVSGKGKWRGPAIKKYWLTNA